MESFKFISSSLKLKENAAEMYPLMVKPDKKVSVKDLIKINRDYHEGTRFDLTKGLQQDLSVHQTDIQLLQKFVLKAGNT